MAHDLGQFTSDGTIHVLDDVEVGGEEDIEVTLMNLSESISQAQDIRIAKVAKTYKWSCHRHGSPLVSSLHHGRIQPRHCVWQGTEITCHKTMCGEVLIQHVEKLHQPRGDIFGQGELLAERWRGADATKVPRTEGAGEWPPRCSLTDAQKASGDGVELRVEVFVELAVRIDQHSTLLRKLGTGVVADGIVAEIIKHLESKEEAGGMHVCVPVKDGPVDNLDAVPVTLGTQGVQQIFRLQVCECR